jgi:hypothetical protein
MPRLTPRQAVEAVFTNLKSLGFNGKSDWVVKKDDKEGIIRECMAVGYFENIKGMPEALRSLSFQRDESHPLVGEQYVLTNDEMPNFGVRAVFRQLPSNALTGTPLQVWAVHDSFDEDGQ